MIDSVRDSLEREARNIESAKLNMSAGNRLLREKKLRLQQLSSYVTTDVSGIHSLTRVFKNTHTHTQKKKKKHTHKKRKKNRQ